MPVVFEVNNDKVIGHVKALDKLHKSALPVAIRETLNGAAFDVKKRTLPDEFRRSFNQRNRGFSKAFSGVQKAKGFNVKQMKAKAGMKDRRPGGPSEQAGRNMKQRQTGGRIKGRSFVPLDTARTGNNNKRRVKKENRLENLNSQLARMVDTRRNRAKSNKQRFVRSVLHAASTQGNGALIRHKGKDGKERIYRLGSVGSRVRTRRLFMKAKPIYTFQSGRSVDAGKTSKFTLKAAQRSQRGMDRIFTKQAERQINRLRKK